MDRDLLASALFPRTTAATYDGAGFLRRSLAGSLDAASMPGRAYSALWHRYQEPMLQNMARTDATPGTPEDYAAFIDRDETKWSQIVKASGAREE